MQPIIIYLQEVEYYWSRDTCCPLTKNLSKIMPFQAAIVTVTLIDGVRLPAEIKLLDTVSTELGRYGDLDRYSIYRYLYFKRWCIY